MRLSAVIAVVVCLCCGCSSSSDKQAKGGPQLQSPKSVAASSNPVAKYIELVGFRITERSAGKLKVEFGVVNHSEADIGDIALLVNLRASTAKPDDAPLVTFDAKVSALGPEDLKQVTVDVPIKLRAYELPDWQFLKADFQITEPR
jgi:hypothetical protein